MNFRESAITKPLAILVMVAIINISAVVGMLLDSNSAGDNANTRQTRTEVPSAMQAVVARLGTEDIFAFGRVRKHLQR